MEQRHAFTYEQFRRLLMGRRFPGAPNIASAMYHYMPILIASAAILVVALDFKPFTKIIHPLFDDPAWRETIHSATQFFFVAVLGGAVALKYRDWEKTQAEERRLQEKARAEERRLHEEAREQRAVRRDRLIEFFRLAVSLQHEYKKIRRTLRAASFLEQGNLLIEREVFEKFMDRLEDCQLRAESLYRQVMVDKELFGFRKRSKKSAKTSNDDSKNWPRQVDAEGMNQDRYKRGGSNSYLDNNSADEDYSDDSSNSTYGYVADNNYANDDSGDDDFAVDGSTDENSADDNSANEMINSAQENGKYVEGKTKAVDIGMAASHVSKKKRVDVKLGDELKTVQGSLREILRQYEDEYIIRRQIDARSLIVINSPLREFIIRNQ